MKKSIDRYPRFIFETSKIKEKRIEYQKPFHRDELTSFYLIRPFSIYISLFIFKKSNITANHITLIMMILSFVAPLIIFFTESINSLFLITPTLFFIIYSLDMIDGEVARMRKETSLTGEFFDAGLWFSLPILFLTYIYKLCNYQSLPTSIIVFTLITISFELFLLVSKELFINKKSFTFLEVQDTLIFKLLVVVKILLTKQNIYIMYPAIFYIMESVGSPKYIYILYWCALLLSYNIYSIYKFKKIYKSINYH
jgi:phosphatidylglycerophosphate synthase